jgi:DNA invertase Pin-like site-specific DNA recombinase
VTAGTGLDAQEHAIKGYFQYALAPKGYEWGELIVDEAVSASKKDFLSRPGGVKLTALLEKGDCVIISKLDRGFRSTRDALETIGLWKKLGYGVHLLDLNLDTTTPIGECMLTVVAAFATLEARRIGERTRESFQARKRAGRPTCGTAPYGFKHVGPAGNRRYAPDPYTRAIGRKIIELRQQGNSIAAIYLHFWRTGVRSRTGGEIAVKTVERYYKKELLLQKKEAKEREEQQK